MCLTRRTWRRRTARPTPINPLLFLACGTPFLARALERLEPLAQGFHHLDLFAERSFGNLAPTFGLAGEDFGEDSLGRPVGLAHDELVIWRGCAICTRRQNWRQGSCIPWRSKRSQRTSVSIAGSAGCRGL